jgi:CubicO group peptidase (beta-lactamase class C family)
MADRLSAEGLARFAGVSASHVSDSAIPGLVALVARGDQVHVETLGTLSVGGAPVRRDSLFRISSTTKPITGALTMALVDDGLLTLDDAVDKWLPELANRRVLRRMDGPVDDTVPAHRPITTRDLLTFTFGFGMVMDMFSADPPWPIVTAENALHLATLGPPQPDEQPDPDSWMAGLGTLPLIAQPGERWLYSTGASALGVLLARVVGQPVADVYRTRLFEPLGMPDTGFFAADTSRLATAYASGDQGLRVWDPPDGQWSHPPALGDGAAGLVSTVDDLLAMARALLRGGSPVLSADSVRQMTTNQLTPAQQANAGSLLDGQGWGLCQSVITEGERTGAYGWDGGLGTSWLVDPIRDLVVIVLTQRLRDGPSTVHTDLQAAAYAALA